MIDRYIKYVFSKANGRVALAFFLCYLVCGTALMQWGSHRISKLSGKEKVQILDLCFTGYTSEMVNKSLSEYSPEARSFAATFNAIADSIYPLLYTAMLAFLLAWIYKSRIEPNSSIRYILLLPLVMMVFDFAENFHIILMLTHYPDIPEDVINAGSFFTQMKWALFVVIILIVLAGLLLKRKQL
jgi:hypothetical protein